MQSAFSAFSLLQAIFCFWINTKWKSPVQLSTFQSLSLVGDNLLVHELRVMAAVELHLNATFGQYPRLKSV